MYHKTKTQFFHIIQYMEILKGYSDLSQIQRHPFAIQYAVCITDTIWK